jgi:hypothetical protein
MHRVLVITQSPKGLAQAAYLDGGLGFVAAVSTGTPDRPRSGSGCLSAATLPGTSEPTGRLTPTAEAITR